MTTREAFRALGRGARCRCPRCGRGKMFRRFYDTQERCSECGLRLVDTFGDIWAFMYLSTAFLTGTFVIALFLLPPPQHRRLGQVLVGIAAIAIFMLTMPSRKGIAIALNWVISSATGDPER